MKQISQKQWYKWYVSMCDEFWGGVDYLGLFPEEFKRKIIEVYITRKYPAYRGGTLPKTSGTNVVYQLLFYFFTRIDGSKISSDGKIDQLLYDDCPYNGIRRDKKIGQKNGDQKFRQDTTAFKYFICQPLYEVGEKVGYSLKGIKENCQWRIPFSLKQKNYLLNTVPAVDTGLKTDRNHIDHKVGGAIHKFINPTDPIRSDNTQFQIVSLNFNTVKRDKCDVCVNTKTRALPPPIMGNKIFFTDGGISLSQPNSNGYYDIGFNPCKGCYWYDPIEFNKKRDELLKREMYKENEGFQI